MDHDVPWAHNLSASLSFRGNPLFFLLFDPFLSFFCHIILHMRPLPAAMSQTARAFAQGLGTTSMDIPDLVAP